MMSQIQLETRHVICQRHGEVFRSDWPAGYEGFCRIGMTKLLRVREFTRKCKGVQARVELQLRRRQMCCWLPKNQLIDLYAECGLGDDDNCCVCGNEKRGVPFSVTERRGAVVAYSHVCFRCIVETLPEARR